MMGALLVKMALELPARLVECLADCHVSILVGAMNARFSTYDDLHSGQCQVDVDHELVRSSPAAADV